MVAAIGAIAMTVSKSGNPLRRQGNTTLEIAHEGRRGRSHVAASSTTARVRFNCLPEPLDAPVVGTAMRKPGWEPACCSIENLSGARASTPVHAVNRCARSALLATLRQHLRHPRFGLRMQRPEILHAFAANAALQHGQVRMPAAAEVEGVAAAA